MACDGDLPMLRVGAQLAEARLRLSGARMRVSRDVLCAGVCVCALSVCVCWSVCVGRVCVCVLECVLWCVCVLWCGCVRCVRFVRRCLRCGGASDTISSWIGKRVSHLCRTQGQVVGRAGAAKLREPREDASSVKGVGAWQRDNFLRGLPGRVGRQIGRLATVSCRRAKAWPRPWPTPYPERLHANGADAGCVAGAGDEPWQRRQHRGRRRPAARPSSCVKPAPPERKGQRPAPTASGWLRPVEGGARSLPV
jgi:hypothetical protein